MIRFSEIFISNSDPIDYGSGKENQRIFELAAIVDVPAGNIVDFHRGNCGFPIGEKSVFLSIGAVVNLYFTDAHLHDTRAKGGLQDSLQLFR